MQAVEPKMDSEINVRVHMDSNFDSWTLILETGSLTYHPHSLENFPIGLYYSQVPSS